jgi:hypothetical protein
VCPWFSVTRWIPMPVQLDIGPLLCKPITDFIV